MGWLYLYVDQRISCEMKKTAENNENNDLVVHW